MLFKRVNRPVNKLACSAVLNCYCISIAKWLKNLFPAVFRIPEFPQISIQMFPTRTISLVEFNDTFIELHICPSYKCGFHPVTIIKAAECFWSGHSSGRFHFCREIFWGFITSDSENQTFPHFLQLQLLKMCGWTMPLHSSNAKVCSWTSWLAFCLDIHRRALFLTMSNSVPHASNHAQDTSHW